jgi:rubredoxin
VGMLRNSHHGSLRGRGLRSSLRSAPYDPRNGRSNLTEGVMAAANSWQCVVCGLIYCEVDGWPEDGIAAGTRWDDVPQDWLCPDCGVRKTDFELISVS